jgi:predicted dehydrogenase
VFTGQRSWLRRGRHQTALARRRGTYTARKLGRLGFVPAATLAGQVAGGQASADRPLADAAPMNTALIGAGRWARVLAPRLSATGRIRWRAICDPHVRRRSLPRALRRLPLYPDIEAMLDRHHLDAAVLCSPNTLHAEQVAQLAPHVRALYVEKPLASSSSQLERIARTAKTFGAFVLAGHGLSGTSGADRIAQRLAQAGDVLSARLVRTLRADYPCDDWRNDPRRCPGGVIAQLGVHLLDLATRLLGPVVIGSVATEPHPRTGQIWSAGITGQAGPAPLNMYCAFAQRDRLELIFKTPRGEIRADESSMSWTSDAAVHTSAICWDDAPAALASRLHAAWWDLQAGVDAHSQAVAEAFNRLLDQVESTRRRATA